jgi:hypothetical protein
MEEVRAEVHQKHKKTGIYHEQSTLKPIDRHKLHAHLVKLKHAWALSGDLLES